MSKPLHEHRISEPLRHQAGQPNQFNHPDAKKTAERKLPASQQVLKPHGQPESQHTVAGAAWDRKDVADAWKGASGRTLACLGQNLDGCGLEAPMFFKPKFIAIALRWTLLTSFRKLQT